MKKTSRLEEAKKLRNKGLTFSEIANKMNIAEITARRYVNYDVEKRRLAHRRYDQSDKGKARLRRYAQSDKGRATKRRYYLEHRQ